MSRVVPGILAAVLALAAAPAPAQLAIQMDVLDLDEAPDHAVKRLSEANQRRAAADRDRRREAPSHGPFLPDDSLGARGLAGVPVESFIDRDRDHDRDALDFLDDDRSGKDDDDKDDGHDGDD